MTRKAMGAAYWKQVAGINPGGVAEAFRAQLICPDDDAPLDWLDTTTSFHCPHCNRVYKADDAGHLTLLPRAEPYAMSPGQCALLEAAAAAAPEAPSPAAPWELIAPIVGELTGKRVLDLGTGHGWAAVWFASRGAHVAAVDLVTGPGGLESARAAASAAGVTIDLFQADTCRLPFLSETFDVIFASRIVAWQPRPERLMKEVGRLLAPNGLFLNWAEPMSEACQIVEEARRRVPLGPGDYEGLFHEGGMKSTTWFPDDRAGLPSRRDGLVTRLRRHWRAHSSREVRLLVGQISPDFQLPASLRGRSEQREGADERGRQSLPR